MSKRTSIFLLLAFFVASVLGYASLRVIDASDQRRVQNNLTEKLTSAEKNVVTRLRACREKADEEVCLQNSYESYAKQFGTVAALQLIRNETISNPTFAGTCHSVMHKIGHVAVGEYGSFQEAYAHGNYDCGNGYFHGVVEEVFRGKSDDSLTPAQIHCFCESVATTTLNTKDYAKLNCVHGLGHALVYKYEGKLSDALPLCTNLLGEQYIGECVAGAFMENMIERLSLKEQSDPLINPSLTCSSFLGDVYRCWLTLASFAIAQENHSLAPALLFCENFTDVHYRAVCGEGLGKAVVIGREGDTVAATLYCKTHAGKLAEYCMKAQSYTAQNASSSAVYSSAFGILKWPISSGRDVLLGEVRMIE